ncbi:hypothetical protein [Sebaldella sp. S0638]|uniref:hypothetical protein n=1 Tax=Sebaldella sp. S0638 TaxID=2957809 RepID=UPI00209FB839|nr:hypothetical protein [Sebaldella sp. S0638]MCP1225523.1 hypothetical protein [Sebaldella sp. S0638]
MNFKNAINRINNVNWNNFMKLGTKEDNLLVYEYLRRLAEFYDEKGITPFGSLYFNAVNPGKECEIDLKLILEMEVVENLKYSHMMRNMISCYLELAKYSDEKPEYSKYLEIYDPLIRILERGGDILYRDGGLMVRNGSIFSLSGWYEFFKNAEPKDIGVMILECKTNKYK